jgi:hypothetical protein
LKHHTSVKQSVVDLDLRSSQNPKQRRNFDTNTALDSGHLQTQGYPIQSVNNESEHDEEDPNSVFINDVKLSAVKTKGGFNRSRTM